MISEKDILNAIGKIDDEIIEATEKEEKRSIKIKASLLIAAVFITVFSVTAVAAASFFNTVNKGDLVFMEAMGGYSGDVYYINFDIDVAEDSDQFLHDYYVPTYFVENNDWKDCGCEAGETYNIMAFDNYDENLFAIFYQYPAWNYDNGAAISYSVPAETEVVEGFFEIEGEKLYCIEFQPKDDGYRGDPFGTRVIFWSDGYNMFVLETRLNMSDSVLTEMVKSIKKVENLSEYVKIKK